eukprot:3936425-Rhodomonas_salina.2
MLFVEANHEVCECLLVVHVSARLLDVPAESFGHDLAVDVEGLGESNGLDAGSFGLIFAVFRRLFDGLFGLCCDHEKGGKAQADYESRTIVGCHVDVTFRVRFDGWDSACRRPFKMGGVRTCAVKNQF